MNYPARLPLDVRGVRWSSLSNHSIFAYRYNINAEGKYVPELQAPHRNARAQDAESLVDGFVTLTFLDGDISVSTRRGQKYMDKHLLDRAYEPVAKPARKVEKAPAAKENKPRPAPEPSVLNERKPVEPVIQLPETRAEVREEPVSTRQNAIPPAEQVEEETGEPAEPKKKPDSWLHRMFNPGSWGN